MLIFNRRALIDPLLSVALCKGGRSVAKRPNGTSPAFASGTPMPFQRL